MPNVVANVSFYYNAKNTMPSKFSSSSAKRVKLALVVNKALNRPIYRGMQGVSVLFK